MIITSLLIALSLSCSKSSAPVPPPVPIDPCVVNGVDTCAANRALAVTINLSSEKQTIHSFGASDCWDVKFIGKNWPLAKRNQIADLLFSKDLNQDGTPKGVGLSMWRMNVGAGSYEQGSNSRIASEWRREECFQNASGQYDWNKQAGNRWFAQAAKQRGVENLLLFTISPPVQYTKNGLAFGDGSTGLGTLNLKEDKYPAFADFLTEVAKNYTQSGLPINYISPINEPQWNWVGDANGNASQEGSSATNAEAYKVISELNTSITNKGLNTKIAYGEAASQNFLYTSVSDNPNRSDIINYFWNPASAGYIGSFGAVEKVVSGHSYFSQPDISSLISNRNGIASRIAATNASLNFWQSEYCILSGEDNIAGGGRDLGINSALYIARVIHTDLALANASSWQWWLSVSPSDYKDGLVYVSDVSGNMGELEATKSDGQVYPSKMLWALGNYSRFVRPGMVRVEASVEDFTNPVEAANGLMISAYKNSSSKELVVVVINMSGSEKKISMQNLPLASTTLKTYTTSSTQDLKYSETSAASNITVGGKSIVTFVGTYK